ncbi:hypothetical protein IGJ55_002099 [Enterococcus sp. AZ170]|uniref:hypothetical protein n=1 Tax=unclassified Enterococcus TaxID=2608891 RepID=UPI003D2B8534
MKKYFDPKTLIIFLLLLSTTILFDIHLYRLGYQGILYFKGISGDFEKPRTGIFLLIGIILIYLPSVFIISEILHTKFQKISNTIVLILGITICIVAFLDLIPALSYVLRFS